MEMAFHHNNLIFQRSPRVILGLPLVLCSLMFIERIPSEMEVAPRYKLTTLLTLLTWFTLLKLFTLCIQLKLLYTAKTLACMPIYIVREGYMAL